MMPAVTCLPVPSITLAVGSLRFLPTLAILPSFNNTSVFSNLPSLSLVQTVAFLISRFSCIGASSQPYPSKGKVTFAKRCGKFGRLLAAESEPAGAAAVKLAVQVTLLPAVSSPYPFHVLPFDTPVKRYCGPVAPPPPPNPPAPRPPPPPPNP